MSRKFFSIILIFVIIMFTVCSSSYCAIQPVTKESLEQAFQDFMNWEEVKDSGIFSGVEVEDDTINIDAINGTDKLDLQVKYNLDNDPIFTTEMNVEQGMTYDEYSEEYENTLGYIFPYIVIAHSNGVDYEYAMSYIVLSYLSILIEQFRDEMQTVEPEEFEANIMEYMNRWYGEPITGNDADEGNTYEITVEQQDVTDTSCKIVTTLKIKADADFARVQEIMEEQFNNTEQNPPETVIEESEEEEETPVITNNNSSNSNFQKTATTNYLPKAGENTKLYFLIGLIVVLVIFFGINYRRLKDVK